MNQSSQIITFPAISQWVADGREFKSRIHTDDTQATAHEEEATALRRRSMATRIEFGAFLRNVRASLPKRGTATNGWKAYLEAIELDDSTAHRYMALAEGATSQNLELRHSEGAEPDPDAPPHTDDDAPPDTFVEVVLLEEPPADKPRESAEDRIVNAIANWLEVTYGYEDAAADLRAGRWRR